MNTPIKASLASLILAGLCFSPSRAQQSESLLLFDQELSQFEVWVGVPHNTVEGLPEGTYQSDKVNRGTAIGLNREIKNIFSVIEENGQPVLKVSGEIYAGLTSLETFGDYHLSVEFKWGEKKWEPRLNLKRDSGILYHCYGEHGRFWDVWKTGLEYQVQETDLGDFISLAGNTAKPKKVGGPKVEIRGDPAAGMKRYDPAAETYFAARGYIHAASEHDAPHGEWNLLEIYTLGNDAVHLVNGHIVMVLENATLPDGTPLVRGQIQLQSEAAECYYRNLKITPIRAFPESISASVRFKD